MTQTKTKNQTAACASILLAAFLWGIIGIWNRALMEAGMSPTTVVAVRNFGGTVVLADIFAVKDRSVFRVQKQHIKYFVRTGLFSVLLYTICYFTCQKISSMAVASVLLYTAPAFVVVLSAILWKEPVTVRKLTALVLTLVGCACVCGLFAGGVTVTAGGILLGLGAGFFYGLYSIFGRYALEHYDSMAVTMWTFLFAGPASLVFLRPSELRLLTDPVLLLMAAGMVVLSTALPYIFYTWGLAQVEPGKASIIASLEMVVASLVGMLLFGEPANALTLVGMVMVLSGVVILR